MPIIELQRRMVEAGRIRAGDKGDKGQPQKLTNWRLTSKDEVRLHAASKMWGGEVREWEGQWELYTETAELPVMLLPGQMPTTWYELWSKGGCQRRCDGVHELLSDSSCLCDADERECKPYTRLSVLLPDLPGIGSWLITSTGWNAAVELTGAADLLQRASAQGVLIPARLRLEQRTKVSQGQTRRFAVPVLDIDVAFRDLLGGQGSLIPPSAQGELPSGYTPIADNPFNGATLADGLEMAETQTLTRKPRVELPDDDVDEDLPAQPDSQPTTGGGQEPKPTKRQLDKLNVLVGELRDRRQKITTENLYAALAKSRNVDVDVMIELVKGRYDHGIDTILHWSPLRDSLTRREASDLIDRLEKLEKNTDAA